MVLPEAVGVLWVVLPWGIRQGWECPNRFFRLPIRGSLWRHCRSRVGRRNRFPGEWRDRSVWMGMPTASSPRSGGPGHWSRGNWDLEQQIFARLTAGAICGYPRMSRALTGKRSMPLPERRVIPLMIRVGRTFPSPASTGLRKLPAATNPARRIFTLTLRLARQREGTPVTLGRENKPCWVACSKTVSKLERPAGNWNGCHS